MLEFLQTLPLPYIIGLWACCLPYLADIVMGLQPIKDLIDQTQDELLDEFHQAVKNYEEALKQLALSKKQLDEVRLKVKKRLTN